MPKFSNDFSQFSMNSRPWSSADCNQILRLPVADCAARAMDSLKSSRQSSGSLSLSRVGKYRRELTKDSIRCLLIALYLKYLKSRFSSASVDSFIPECPLGVELRRMTAHFSEVRLQHLATTRVTRFVPGLFPSSVKSNWHSWSLEVPLN